MPFEVFRQETAAETAQPMISITKGGVISFNKSVYAKLGKPQAVELMFDSDRHLVGLRAADPKLTHARQVRTTTRGTGYLVSAASFINHYGLGNVMARWPAQVEGDVLFIDIRQG